MVLDLERIAEETRFAANQSRRRLETLELKLEDAPRRSV